MVLVAGLYGTWPSLLQMLAAPAAGSFWFGADLPPPLSLLLPSAAALLLAWGASVLAARPPSERYTYGLKSSSILAAIYPATKYVTWFRYRRKTS